MLKMISGSMMQAAIKFLDRIAKVRFGSKASPGNQLPAHILTGRRGEEAAYFYLRKRGYVMVARNFRTSRHRSEIDLIGWAKDRGQDVLCFIEVKTRTTRDVKPAQAAVDRKKRHDLRVVIRHYLRALPRRQFPTPPQWRFDVLAVYYDGNNAPSFELFRNARLSS